MSWLKQPIYYNSDIFYYHALHYTVCNEDVYVIHQIDLYGSCCETFNL